MNEGENSGMSNGPAFSSSQSDNNQPTQAAPISSGDKSMRPEKSHFGFGFGSRHFKDKAQTPAAPIMQASQSTTFANAPEFFNNAVDDIALADAAEVEKKARFKKNIKIGGLIALVAIILIVGCGFIVSPIIRGGQVSGAKKTWTRFANYVIYGEEKDDELPESAMKTSQFAIGKLADYERGGRFAGSNKEEFYKRYDEAKKSISDYIDKADLKALDEQINDIFFASTLSTNFIKVTRLAQQNGTTSSAQVLSAFDSFKAATKKNNSSQLTYAYLNLYEKAANLTAAYKDAGMVSNKGILASDYSNVPAAAMARISKANEEYAKKNSEYTDAKKKAVAEIIDQLVMIHKEMK